MKNQSSVHADELNVFITSEIKSNGIGKVILSMILSGGFMLFIYLFVSLDFKEMGKSSIPIILIPAAFLFFFIRYLLWNIYGQEHIIINSKSLTYYYCYGFFRTQATTVLHRKLTIDYIVTDRVEDEDFGRMSFVSYDANTNLPEVIHKTAVEINDPTAAKVQRLLAKVIFTEYSEEKGFRIFDN